MNSTSGLVLLACLSCFLLEGIFFDQSNVRRQRADRLSGQQTSPTARLEAAYRLNNIGVALLEQYKTREAAEYFSQALQLEPELLIAHINLSISFYYLSDTEPARREAEKALALEPNAPQPHFILGQIARLANLTDNAIVEYKKVLKTDPGDSATNIALGQIYVQQKKTSDAVMAFRTALDTEPYNETALYNLGLLLTRTGSKEEGQRLVQKFQELRSSGAGVSIGTNYLEGGRYAEAIVSSGAEADLVNANTPAVKFTDATPGALRATSGTASQRGSGNLEKLIRDEPVVLFDYDRDGDLDLLDTAGPQRLFRNDSGQFLDVTAGSGLTPRGRESSAAVAGDYDNDGKPDLLVVRFNENSLALYHNDGNGRFSDQTDTSGLQLSKKASPYLSAAFLDCDHDGDLDIFITGPTNILFRNNGDGKFADISARANLARDNDSPALAVVPTDFDNRRDVDLLILTADRSPTLFRNMRDGTFRDVTKDAGLERSGQFWCVAAGDVNKDGLPDFFLGADGPGVFALSDGKGRFKIIKTLSGTKNARGAQILDYDNDGLLDLVVLTTTGLRVLRNLGREFRDESMTAVPYSFRTLRAMPRVLGMLSPHVALASGDIDGDGDTDLILRGQHDEIRILRNDGGNLNHSIKVNLQGRASNKSAVEAKIEMRAGSLWQRLETYAASPAPAPADVIFGLGKRKAADAVRVIWPADIIQTETDFAVLGKARAGSPVTLNITEIDRKPSSCPYLYTWNGRAFEFVTDFMGGGEMGYLEEPGRYNEPDSDEYVRIREDQLKEKNGLYELRVTNELEEAVFLDRLQLMVLTHPSETEVYPNEGMSGPPKPFNLFTTRNARPPLSAVDDHGHSVLELISRLDRRYPNDFKLERIRGYAAEHSLTLKLAEPSQSNSGKTILLFTGWTDYAWSSDNVAASQAGKAMKLPALQVKDTKGHWQTVIPDIGIPVGRPQTVTVDLTGKFLSPSREVRIVTSMRIYWDQILVDLSGGNARVEMTPLDPTRCELRWRGFSAEITPDGREPFFYDYERVSFNSPWKVMTGRYTREGDVRQLLLKSDDMFVISRPGDEISVSFPAGSLPPLPNGYKRTFLLHADGFSKEMDINSASPDQVGPLPFHGMSRYPYKWPEHYPMTPERQEYIEKYNTRVVTSPVPSIGTLW